MKKILFLLVLFPSLAQAQVHYCDTVPPTSGTTTLGIHPIQLCQPSGDVVTGFKLYIDGLPTAGAVLTLTTDNVVSTSGHKLWKGTVQVLQGTHTYQATAVNTVGESAKSSPFTLTANPVPTVPSSPVRVKVG